ncbi:MAG: hypothetical protein ACXVNM_00705 [Bacteroidia bacterium]
MPHLGNEIWDELYAIASSSYAADMSSEKIQELLLKKCGDEPLAYAVLKKAKSDYYDKCRKEGLVIIAAGAAVIFAGFVITCFNFHANQSVSFAMYGLTTIGIGIVFYGLYKIIG